VPRVAYVLWHFPKLSETFVVDELLALAAVGVEPDIIARQRYDEPVTNPRAAPLLRRACWLREQPRRHQLAAVARLVARHPLRCGRCLFVAAGTLSRWTLLNLWFGLVLADLVERRRIEYLHAHFADDAAELAYFASTVTGVPYGVTAHGVDIYVNRFLCPKLSNAALVVTVCRYNADQLAARCPHVRHDDMLLKYAGVDPTLFAPPGERADPEVPLVVAVGRLVPKKGFGTLVRAVAALRDRDHHVRCTIVGSGPEEEPLRALVDDLGVGDRVMLAGPLPPAEVVSTLQEATLLAAPCTIAPSGDRDSMPVVIKEAMAMGLPVVASDDFGIPELVTPDCGRLVPRDDPQALADALAAVVSLPAAERAAMGQAGRARICADFDERHLVAPLVAAFAAAVS
jgi:colanic acid/amylovoran biosynthesis glycosyltransferase